jgi:hypothetical protein
LIVVRGAGVVTRTPGMIYVKVIPVLYDIVKRLARHEFAV